MDEFIEVKTYIVSYMTLNIEEILSFQTSDPLFWGW